MLAPREIADRPAQPWLGADVRRLAFVALVLFGFAVSAWSIARIGSSPGTARNLAAERAMDLRLQQAALAALGDRRGTIIVMDSQTGRVRAVVNPELAFQESFPPGS